MTTALAEIPTVTGEQLDLIRRTVANGATADELKLYLYDCSRQGVHPLDKLIFFTKRKGKYTPITSIDFMRTRAADTGEYAGSDDAVFDLNQVRESNHPEAAHVTVWRMVQGQRCSFTATARWSEYYPGDGEQGFMWRKMPHTMLAKCAEALALRKGFPRQLAGLFAKEEMDQAGDPQGDTAPNQSWQKSTRHELPKGSAATAAQDEMVSAAQGVQSVSKRTEALPDGLEDQPNASSVTSSSPQRTDRAVTVGSDSHQRSWNSTTLEEKSSSTSDAQSQELTTKSEPKSSSVMSGAPIATSSVTTSSESRNVGSAQQVDSGDSGPDLGVDLVPPGAVLIRSVVVGRAGGKSKGAIITNTGEEFSIWNDGVLSAANEAHQKQIPVFIEQKVPASGGKPYAKGITRAVNPPPAPMLEDRDIHF